MMKHIYIIVTLCVLLGSLATQVLIYREWVPKLLWSVETLSLNVTANRDAWKTCRRFRWCGEVEPAPQRWKSVWVGELRWTI
jgi:hypothetical protein